MEKWCAKMIKMWGGLSTYYAIIRYCAEIISRIMTRIGDLNKTTKNECDDFSARWELNISN